MSAERTIMWTPWIGPGLEHLRLVQSEHLILADGLIIGVAEEDGLPFRARYTIQCDAHWRVRELRVDMLDTANRRLDLMSDGAGHWAGGSGELLPGLAGCFDVDISATPFTNTLPIRRLALPPGASADINVVYITLPELTAAAAMQRYTCLAANAGGAHYRFESRLHDFVAELPVDADGLVQDYPELFRRIMTK
ncbi:MAG TPA: putative glycolipid-binding domain-containing protein [Roseiflexaceae bacterium]|nr:putative glycolipid-binding domain-containing protein [Roseiflexaceae bacterium]